MRDLAFGLIWLFLLPMSLMSAYIGILLWVWVAILVPGYSLYGPMAGVPFNKMVALTTVVIIFVKRDVKDFYKDATLVALGLLLVVATASWLFAIVPSDDGTELYQKLLKEMVLAITIMGVMVTRHRIHLVLIIVALSLGFYSVTEGLQFVVTAGGHKILGVPSIGDNNSLATAVLMVIPILAYLARYSAVRLVKWAFVTVLVMSLLCVIGTYSRGGFVGLLVLAGFMVAKSKNRFASLSIVVVAGALVFALAPASWFERLQTLDSATTEDTSFLGRVVAWKISTLIAMDRPLLGGGPHAVQRFLVWQTYRPGIHIFDFIKTPPADNTPHAAHSVWFEILGDLGFTGLLLFCTALGLALWNCRQIIRMARGHPSIAWAADLAQMLQISLVVFAVTASALSMGYFELLYIFFALLSRVRRTARQTIEAESRSATEPIKLPSRIALGRPGLGRPLPGRYAQNVTSRDEI